MLDEATLPRISRVFVFVRGFGGRDYWPRGAAIKGEEELIAFL